MLDAKALQIESFTYTNNKGKKIGANPRMIVFLRRSPALNLARPLKYTNCTDMVRQEDPFIRILRFRVGANRLEMLVIFY